MGSIYAKLAGAVLVLVALAALWLWGHHVGTASVQAQWDLSKAQQQAATANQRAASAQQTLNWTQQFAGISAHYEATAHETSPPVADATAAAVHAGTLRLSHDTDAARCAGAVPAATARARAADAAATQALADRVTAAIAAVRAGDDADARERQLGEQVKALQALLQAERKETAP